MLVGDVIMSFREQATDLPQAYPAPYIVSVTQLQVPDGGLGPSTVYLVVTTIGPWGETVGNAETVVQMTAPNNALLVKVVTFPNSVAIRVYYSINVPGNEVTYEEFPVFMTTGVTDVSVLVVNNGLNGFPPNRSTAYNPDSDGFAVGAYAAYRWLNQALTWAASKNKGGIPAFGAVGTVSRQPLYTMPGWWKKINNAWYDGFPLYLARHNDVFRRGPVPGTVGAFLVHEATERLIAECWPQPSRTSCQTLLAAPMSVYSDTAELENSNGWVLGFGKVQIDDEIMEYSALAAGSISGSGPPTWLDMTQTWAQMGTTRWIDLTGNVSQSGASLVGLTRGLAGTKTVAHAVGAPVTELNLEISGFRLPSSYSVGSALSTLLAPPGWENPLAAYMLYKFRSAEQDDNGAMRFLKEATEMLADLSANRIIAGPRQIQANAGRGAETMAGLGSPFGGVIVP